MTYLELQNQIMGRLNLTSPDARNRIKGLINDRYREVASSTGLTRVRPGTVNVTVTAGNPVATVTAAKLFTIFDPTFLKYPLNELSLDQLRHADAAQTVTGVPRAYAVSAHGASTITIELYPKPSADNTLKADVLVGFTPLVNESDEPTFPEDFHDLLVDGVMAYEYQKMEKVNPLSVMAESRYQKRLSDLRYFIAKSAYLRRVPMDTNLPGGLVGRVWPYTNLA